MSIEGAVGIGLLLAGSFLGVPVAIVLGMVLVAFELVRQLWSRRGLQDIHYDRSLARDRLEWGDETTLTVSVWNRQRLPLAWLRAADTAGPGVVVRERPLMASGTGRSALRNVWTLAPFERVVREFHVGADRRGVFELGPVFLGMGDLFAREAASEERAMVDRFLVRPRTVPAPVTSTRTAGAARTAPAPACPKTFPLRRDPRLRPGRPDPPHPSARERPPGPPRDQAVRAIARS